MERRKQRTLKSRLILTRRLTGWLLALAILAISIVTVLGTPLPTAVQKLADMRQARREAKLQAQAQEAAEAAEEAARASLGSPFEGVYSPAQGASDDFDLNLETQAQLEDLFDRLMNPEWQTFEEYSRLFYQVSEGEIRRYYGGELAAEYRPYTEKAVTTCFDLGDRHYIEMTAFTPDRSFRVFSFCARYSGGRFYFTHADAKDLVTLGVAKEEKAMKTLGVPYIRFLAARAAGGNAVQEVVPGYLTERLAWGHWTYAPVYAWQQADGAVIMGIWVVNYTYEDMPLHEAAVSITDGGETVCRYTVALDENVPQGKCRLIELVIPADQIVTGLDPWSEDASCDGTVK